MNITDEMLSQAAPEAAERWLSTLPERKDCGHDFSLTFQASMEPLLRRKRRHWRGLVPLAAVIVVLAGLLAFSAGADRPDEYRVYAAQEDGWVSYRLRPKDDGAGQVFHRLTPSWLPEGLVLDELNIQENHAMVRYEEGEQRGFILHQWHDTEVTSTILGQFQLENTTVDGNEAIYITPMQEGPDYLLWTQGADGFLMTPYGLEREEIFRIAANLKW